MCTKPLKGWLRKDGKGITFTLSYGYNDYPKQVPCGQCIECRLEKCRQWAIRMTQESQMHEESSFITLTYDEDALPDNQSINKTDVQLFIKRLRQSIRRKEIKNIKEKYGKDNFCPLVKIAIIKDTKKHKFKKISYYACGEYGDDLENNFKRNYGGLLGRPHYHIILFGYYPSDTVYYKKSKYGNLFKSKELFEIWQKKGHVTVGAVTFESASYTARYTTKKINGEKQEEHYQGKEPEFALMSRRPAIGMRWLEKYGDETWRDGYIITRGYKMRPPMAYRRKLKNTEPELYEKDKKRSVNPFISDPDYHYLYGLLDPRRLLARDKIATTKFNLTKNKTL